MGIPNSRVSVCKFVWISAQFPRLKQLLKFYSLPPLTPTVCGDDQPGVL